MSRRVVRAEGKGPLNVERRRLGRSGLEVSVVWLGTWQVLDVRGRRKEEERHEVVGAALESGMELFDSSPMYGEAERVLGDALRKYGRDRATVATKVWTSDDQEAQLQIENAINFLDGRVELYQVHNLVAAEKRLGMLEELQNQGKIRSIGATHYSHSAFPNLMNVMRSGRVDFVQVPYNATDVTVAEEVLPLAEELGRGVIAMIPLGSGRLIRNAPADKDLEALKEFGIET
jgi:aryl-alcohol dehydrogenase-like predicted oxidoreductase